MILWVGPEVGIAVHDTQREAVLIIYLAGGISGMVAMFIMQADAAEGYGIAIMTAALGLYGIWWLEKKTSSV